MTNPKIKNNINNIYKTPIFIPEAMLEFPFSKDVSAAALQVAHCENALFAIVSKKNRIDFCKNFIDLIIR